MAAAREQVVNNVPVVKEIIVAADETSLNRAMVEKRISPANIIGDLPTATCSRDR